MFHHQKSSRSSGQNLEINLLQPKQRDSGIIIARTHHNNVTLNHLKRRSAHTPHTSQYTQFHQRLLQNQQNPNIYETYTVDKIDFSQSLLTNTNQNNRVVGIILFIILIILTNTQTISLCASQQILQISQLFIMGIYLCICQLIAFGILYYYQWVQNISIVIKYLRIRPRTINQTGNTSPIVYIALRPYLLIPIILFMTIIWQFCYTYMLLYNQQITHLILFYTIILPQIVISLYCQQSLHEQKQKNIRIAYYCILVYLIVVGLIEGGIAIVGVGILGAGLLYLGVRVGRVCLFIQYFAKFIIFIILCLLWIFSSGQQSNQTYYPQPIPINYQYTPLIPTIILLTLLSTMSIILVRCLNNKILRPQLYKYFYSDYTINNALLCLPFIICYIYNTYIDIFITVIGCLTLVYVGYIINCQQNKLQIQKQVQNYDDGDINSQIQHQQINELRKNRKDKGINKNKLIKQKQSNIKNGKNQAIQLTQIHSYQNK